MSSPQKTNKNKKEIYSSCHYGWYSLSHRVNTTQKSLKNMKILNLRLRVCACVCVVLLRNSHTYKAKQLTKEQFSGPKVTFYRLVICAIPIYIYGCIYTHTHTHSHTHSVCVCYIYSINSKTYHL